MTIDNGNGNARFKTESFNVLFDQELQRYPHIFFICLFSFKVSKQIWLGTFFAYKK